jgi:hypothetical protein
MRAALAMRPEGGVRRNAARSGSPKRESDDITAASGEEGARADVDVALSLARNAGSPVRASRWLPAVCPPPHPGGTLRVTPCRRSFLELP